MNAPCAAIPNLAGGKPAEEHDYLLQRRARLVRPWLQGRGGWLVDLGCGNGAQTRLLAPGFSRVLGLDIDVAFLRRFLAAANRGEGAGVFTAACCDGSEIPCRDAHVDCVVSFEVLEHVEREAEALSEILRVLRPGGLLVISVPNRWWLFETHGANLPILRWNRVPFFSWLPRRWHDRWARARIYRRREIVALLRQAGFHVQAARYITAPMDVVRWRPLRELLRRTLFRRDATPWPWLATSCLVLARRPEQSGQPAGMPQS
jgi:SAM-dependent methyltransferase